jgi:Uncharacterized protein conserved in bacteria (DUF2188)
MPGKNQHVIPHVEGWAVKGEGNSRATRVFYTQREAIEFGREVAIKQRAELVIHNRKGEVRDRNNYRNYKTYPNYSTYGTSFYFLSGLSSTQTLQCTIQNHHEQGLEADGGGEGASENIGYQNGNH